MPLRFDAMLKDLARRYPVDYVSTFRLGSTADIHALNVDLSVISAATDVVLGHGDPPKSILDLNFQSGPDPNLSDRVCLYNAVLRYQYHVPVHSVAILLRPKADDPRITGRLVYTGQPRRGKMDFRFEVFRIWKVPAQRLLRSGPGVLPLSVLGALPPGVSKAAGVADVIDHLWRRVQSQYPPDVADYLFTSTFVLSGLRLDREFAVKLFRRYHAVEDSTTYQYIIEQGALRGVRALLLEQGASKFGAPTDKVKDAIQGLEDLPRLKRMGLRCSLPPPGMMSSRRVDPQRSQSIMGDPPTQSSTRIPATSADDHQEAARTAGGPRFSLSQMMTAIAGLGVILAIVVQDPGLIVPILFVASIFVPCLFALSKLPGRIRLTIEILTACFLLVMSAWVWRPPFYVYQPDRIDQLARLCSWLANESDDDRSKALFRREAAWYRRKAFELRLQAMWYGLIRSVTKEDPVPITDRELILELGTLEAIERHERIAEQMEKTTKKHGSGSLY